MSGERSMLQRFWPFTSKRHPSIAAEVRRNRKLVSEPSGENGAVVVTQVPEHERELYPWLAGACEWSERYGTLIDEKRAARVGQFVALGIAAIATIGAVAAIAYARNTKIVPWVVQVDKTNWAVAIGPADQAMVADERVMLSMAARWVRAMRTVIGNAEAQTVLVQEVYAMLAEGSAATKKANTWFLAHNPMVGIGKKRVELEISRVYAMRDARQIAVEWTERATSDERATEGYFVAHLWLEVSPTRTQDEIISNPLGIYVADFTISELTPRSP